MLQEIECSAFRQKKVTFHSGLNVVLGDDNGSNSIGKSTFLMILDFVFGGDTYTRQADIKRHVEDHVINFSFVFQSEKFYFSRSIDSDYISCCDDCYNVKKQISKAEYNLFLYQKYQINFKKAVTFRSAVGRYLRVHGKANILEKMPLHSTSHQKGDSALLDLSKLFDRYYEIEELDLQRQEKQDRLKAFNNARKFDLIPTITFEDYNKNIQTLLDTENDMENIRSQLSTGIVDLSAEQVEQLIGIRGSLNDLTRQKAHIKSKLAKLDIDKNKSGVNLEPQIVELKSFFQELDLQKIENIERFHNKITKILSQEIEVQREELLTKLEILNGDIKNHNDNIDIIMESDSASKLALSRLVELQKRSDTLGIINNTYEAAVRYKCASRNAKSVYDQKKSTLFNELLDNINIELNAINDFISGGRKNAPEIRLKNSGYEFLTPDDEGTGTQYKSLIEFDLSILRLTPLPLLIHDSLLFKNISDDVINKILELYIDEKDKQIFIAFDRQDSYKDSATQDILNRHAVLKLSAGKELFGFSWNNK